MVDLRQVISQEEIEILFHDSDIGRRVVTDENNMIMVEVWIGIYEVCGKYMEYHGNGDYGYFYGLFSDLLTLLQDTGIIRFYKKIDDPDYPIIDEEVLSYLRSEYREEVENAIFRIKKECGPFQLYYNKEKVSLFQKIYFNPGGGLCRESTLKFLLRTIEKISTSKINIQDFIDWMGIEGKYAFYNWEFLIFAIGYSTPENIAKMFAYIARFMTEEERENFHFELLAERNVVHDNSMSQFKGKFQNYYYRIEPQVKDNASNKVIEFLDKINRLKVLAKEGILETREEQDLITEFKSFPYESIIDNDLILRKIKKLKIHPQTIWATQSSRGYSKAVNQYILDWECIFQENNGNKSTPVQIINSEKIIRITPYICYDLENQEFLNPKNGKRCKLKEEYSRQMIELLIFKNEQKVIDFVEDNKVILSEFKKGKRGGGKWVAMHTFLQSKIKNITEKIEYHLEIDKNFRSNFITCDKENIAIKVSLK